VFYGIAANDGTLAYQKLAPTREAADKLLNERLAAPFTADANDVLYQWDASREYNAAPGLERIQPRYWRSTRRTTSAFRRQPESWSVNSSA
jgi:homoserine O-acetyltransferase